MSDTTIQTMEPSLRLELETLRDQRDLYRSLLLAEPTALGAGACVPRHARAVPSAARSRTC
jgi:hypothetical protein